MEIYEKMYLKLFNAVTDAIRLLPEEQSVAREILIKAQQNCEELFMETEEQ